MEYTVELAEKIAAKLRQLPAVENKKRRINKQEMVEHFAEEIASAQERGYSLEQIVESLKGEGFDIGLPTLKTYVQRAQKKPRGRRSAKGKKTNTPRTVDVSAKAEKDIAAKKSEQLKAPPVPVIRSAAAAKLEAAEKKKGDDDFQGEDSFK
jgi:hypothetical protein